MSIMRYKEYSAKIAYSDEDQCFTGRVTGIRDIITFHGDSVLELKKAFREAVDFYMESCVREGVIPQRSYSGKVMIRIPPEVHAHAVMQAEAHGKSLNQWIAEALSTH